jgi:hypothetical protein
VWSVGHTAICILLVGFKDQLAGPRIALRGSSTLRRRNFHNQERSVQRGSRYQAIGGSKRSIRSCPLVAWTAPVTVDSLPFVQYHLQPAVHCGSVCGGVFVLPFLLIASFAPAPATLVRTVAEGTDSRIRERLEIVVRTSDEWRTLWNRLAPGRALPAVDFAQEMVVGAFLGRRPREGCVVEVVSVAREDANIVVRYREHLPGGQSRPGETAPYLLVAIPRDRRPVRFIQDIRADAP